MIKLKELIQGKYELFCDLDGVLADFDKGYEQLTGVHPDHAEEGAAFWEPIDKAGAQFWANLEWMPDGKELWQHIKQYNPKLLSAPSRQPSSKEGKHQWVAKYPQEFGNTELILARAVAKQKYSGEDKILIDDREKNIDEWRSKGGIGILHKNTKDTLQQLKKLGL